MKQPKVVLLVQTPPPYHGQAVMQGYLVTETWTWCEKVHIRMAFSERLEEVARFRFRKVVELFRVLARLVWERLSGPIHVVYYPPAGASVFAFVRDLAILPVALLLTKRVVLHYHSGGIHTLIARVPTPLRALARWLYARAALGIVLAPSLVADTFGIRTERIIIIPNGVDEPSAGCSIAANKSARALYVGTLMPEKGILDLLGGLREARSQGAGVSLDLVGGFVSEEFRSECMATIERLELQEHVCVHGVLVADDKWNVYRAAGIFVFPTYYPQENQPVALIEAMMWGLPIISTWWRAISDMMTDMREGFLVAPRDVAAIGNRLTRFGLDGELRAKMGAAARRRYEQEYSLRIHLDRMTSALRHVALQR